MPDDTNLMPIGKAPTMQELTKPQESEHHSRTRDVIRFIAPPRVRKIGWYVLCGIWIVLGLIHVNDWAGGSVKSAWDWFWANVWNGVGAVPFFLGGFLFRYMWPIRETSEGE